MSDDYGDHYSCHSRGWETAFVIGLAVGATIVGLTLYTLVNYILGYLPISAETKEGVIILTVCIGAVSGGVVGVRYRYLILKGLLIFVAALVAFFIVYAAFFGDSVTI